MDIFAHALWSFILFFRFKKLRWWAALVGFLPDVFVVIPHWFVDHQQSHGQRVYDIAYQYTHSWVVFAIFYLLLFLITKKQFIVLLAWPFHAFLDLFTHPVWYYPTPFLWPLSSPIVPAFYYRNTTFMIVNYVLIIGILIYLNVKGRKVIKKKSKK